VKATGKGRGDRTGKRCSLSFSQPTMERKGKKISKVPTAAIKITAVSLT
jgi:hypothetical protein